MKKLALISALLFSNTTGVWAADIMQMSVGAHDWSGFYIGGHAGYGSGTAEFSITPGGNWVGDADLTGVSSASNRNSSPKGFLGGLQFGFNKQIGSLVLGVEADISAASIKGSFASGNFNGVLAGTTYAANGVAGSHWLSTARARIGFVAGDALIYVTGGAALANNHFSHNINYLNNAPIPTLPVTGPAGGSNSASPSRTNVGWVLGGGVEYALNANWSVKAEYLYANLGSNTAQSRYVSAGNWDMTHGERKSVNIVRLGINYNFSTGANAVVAKY